MATVYAETTPSSLIGMSRRQFGQVLLTGAIAGLIVWGMTFILDHYVYQLIFCRGANVRCDSSMQYALVTAELLAAIFALFSLVRLQVFRPLLIVLAVVVSLWGVLTLTTNLPWFGAAMALAAMYALAYLLFAWIVRVRSFILAALITVVLVVIIRFVING